MNDYYNDPKYKEFQDIITEEEQKIEYKEGDYNCDKCGYLGNFNNGDIFGIGKKNIEKFLCNDCLNIND